MVEQPFRQPRSPVVVNVKLCKFLDGLTRPMPIAIALAGRSYACRAFISLKAFAFPIAVVKATIRAIGELRKIAEVVVVVDFSN